MRTRILTGVAMSALVLVIAQAAPAREHGALSPPWSEPLSFNGLAGWHTGRSGTVHYARTGSGARFRLGYPESAAWIANVRYRDDATSDPPQNTVHEMSRNGIVVWAAVTPVLSGNSAAPLDLRLKRFHRGLCCDGTPQPYTRQWDTAGRAAGGRYDVIVRVYFGSAPTAAMLASANRAIRALALPR